MDFQIISNGFALIRMIRGKKIFSYRLRVSASLREFLSFAILPFAFVPRLPAAEPRLLVDSPGFGLECVAREPDIVTPIGVAFDLKGRLLVVESHTHFRPADYQGPPGDRIRMFADANRDGRLDTWTTFAEGYQQSMNLCVRPDGAVYLVTRRDVRLLEDTDGDGKSDKETVILRLETTGDYPHNGMSGIAFRPRSGKDKSAGVLVVGVGENSGNPYTIIGSDGDESTRGTGPAMFTFARPTAPECGATPQGFGTRSRCALSGETFMPSTTIRIPARPAG